MVEIVEEFPPLPPLADADIGAQEGHQPHNIVSAGESAAGEQDDYEDIFSATDDDLSDDEEGRAYYRWDPSSSSNSNNYAKTGETPAGITSRRSNDNEAADLLYDENLDEEDEAYVYKHMRGGIRETVTVNTTTSKDPAATAAAAAAAAADTSHDHGDERDSGGPNSAAGAVERKTRRQVVQMYKPRTSDAVLSCPCCFNIVCMDCQKHKRYANQYRAMFVMGVAVDWNNILVYDDVHRALVPKIAHDEEVEEEQHAAEDEDDSFPLENTTSIYDNNPLLQAKCGEYYAVECATCRTQVAALDMTDEVYYFQGCLESSSAF